VVIDYAGPWESVENVHAWAGRHGRGDAVELYTVDATASPFTRAAGMKPGHDRGAGLWLCGCAGADVVVVGGPVGRMTSWVPGSGKVTEQHALIMSVCTGAFRWLRPGSSTASRRPIIIASLQRLANQYPRIAVRSSVLTSSPTRSYLTRRLELRHRLGRSTGGAYYGAQVASTADYMESGQGWKTNAGTGEPKQVLPTIPLAYRDHETIWQGTLLPDYPKPKPEMPVGPASGPGGWAVQGTIDAPTESMIGEPLDDVRVDHGSIHFTLASEHGPVDFSAP